MPTIGWFEILIIVVLSIIILGPKDFPIMLKKVGSWIGIAKKHISNIQNEVSSIDIDLESTDDKKDLNENNINKTKEKKNE
jgi:sec-independent protein translocase protein TatB